METKKKARLQCMVNKPQPKDYSNFQSYANAVRQWYLNKPQQNTNSLQLFTNALHNYFRERGGPSNQQNMVQREVIKMYKSLNNVVKNHRRVPETYYKMLKKLKTRPRNNMGTVHENLKKFKRNLRLSSTNNASLKTFSKIFEKETGTQLGPAYNILKKKLTSWKPTGKYLNWSQQIKLLRHPNTGNIGFMSSDGNWYRWANSHRRGMYFEPKGANRNQTKYLRNLNIWRNEDGILWVHINGKWYRIKLP